MNVVVSSFALARLGHQVDLFTRRSDPAAPDVVEVAEGVRLFHLDAGPARPLAKSAMEQAIRPFRAALREVLTADSAGGWDLLHSHHWFSGVAARRRPRAGIPTQSFHSVAPEGAGTRRRARRIGGCIREQFAATGPICRRGLRRRRPAPSAMVRRAGPG